MFRKSMGLRIYLKKSTKYDVNKNNRMKIYLDNVKCNMLNMLIFSTNA